MTTGAVLCGTGVARATSALVTAAGAFVVAIVVLGDIADVVVAAVCVASRGPHAVSANAEAIAAALAAVNHGNQARR